jgi:ribosomal protein L7/L12
MELIHIVIAVVVLALAFLFIRLLSGTRDASKVLGAAPPDKPAGVTAATAAGALPEARRLLAAGRKIEAIKLLREQTGLGLKEAKETVEALEQSSGARLHGKLADTMRHAQDASEEVKRLVRSGQKIEAIKLVREQTGLGLKEAKDLVDRLG